MASCQTISTSQSDQLRVNNTATLTGTLQISLINGFIPTSGKQTFGLGSFYNGCHSRPERGLEISTLALVNVTQRYALTLAVAPTVILPRSMQALVVAIAAHNTAVTPCFQWVIRLIFAVG